MQFILKLRCPLCGHVDVGIAHEAGTVYQARQTSLACPHHESEDMEVVEVADSAGGIRWQDPKWLREDAKLAREIDDLGSTGND